MKKPSYKELEQQIIELKQQLDFILLKTDLLSVKNEEREGDLKAAKEIIKYEEGEKEKRADELIVVNKRLNHLLELNADKDRFISILAHDLRSPFNGILGILELLIETIQENDIEYSILLINKVYDSAQKTFHLLEELIKWTQAQIGSLPFKPQEYLVKDIFLDVIDFVQPLAELKKINIFHYADEEMTVFADVNMLKTIIRNLISNSIKFTDPYGQIDIYAIRVPSHLQITVEDSGIGMQPEQIEQLFDISSVNTLSGTEEEKGSGLGLIICKELTEKHNGKIYVESEIGKGSRFNILLPFVENA